MRQHHLLSDLAAIEQQLTQMAKGPNLFSPEATTANSTWSPAVDIYETPASFVLTAEVPGVQQSGIDVKVVADTLILRGERRWTGEGEQFHRLESSYGKFERQFGLSESIDVDQITAELQRGVLRLVLPKHSAAEPTREIKVDTK